MPIAETIRNIPGRMSNSDTEIVFLASDLPPLGFKSYYIKLEKGDTVVKAAKFKSHYENVNNQHQQNKGTTVLFTGRSYKSGRRLRSHNRNHDEWKNNPDQAGVSVLSRYSRRQPSVHEQIIRCLYIPSKRHRSVQTFKPSRYSTVQRRFGHRITPSFQRMDQPNYQSLC